jgi:cyclophilin family peptidyl-prolyl cis-trans isomerase
MKKILLLGLLISLVACNNQGENDRNKDVELITSKGSIIIRLSDKTPKHRDNFIKLVKDQFYDSINFHRVINKFLIQAGDPRTKTANPDDENQPYDLPYLVPAEFDKTLFHKRGAVNAARNGDDENPFQMSSSTQFTIIQGKIFNDSLLDVSEGRINKWRLYNKVLRDPKNQKIADQLTLLYKNKVSYDSILKVRKSLEDIAEKAYDTFSKYKIPVAHRKVYKSIGGAAHLDQNYTVFGEVIKGMDIVDAIAQVETAKGDRPVIPVTILSARLIERED